MSQNCQDQGKFKSTSSLHGKENFCDVRLQEMLHIVWKQNHKSEHGTCDKKVVTTHKDNRQTSIDYKLIAYRRQRNIREVLIRAKVPPVPSDKDQERASWNEDM